MKLNILSAIVAVGMLATSTSQAALTLTFSDGTTTKSYNDSATPGTVAPSTTTVGNWIVSGNLATFSYILSNPNLYYAAQLLTGPHNLTTLTITLTESGLTAIPSGAGTIFMDLNSQQANVQARINVSQTAKVTGTQVGSVNSINYPGGYPNAAQSTIDTYVTSGLNSTYNLTEVFTITGTGGATLGKSGLDLVPSAPAPEPATYGVFAGALVLLPFGAKLLRRRQTA